jgi:hypothetical protein
MTYPPPPNNQLPRMLYNQNSSQEMCERKEILRRPETANPRFDTGSSQRRFAPLFRAGQAERLAPSTRGHGIALRLGCNICIMCIH